ncbi:MAG: integrin [Ramlibacter sp.]|nr:integrin [Ramlibacter sp.]
MLTAAPEGLAHTLCLSQPARDRAKGPARRSWMRCLAVAAAGLACALLLSACGGGGSDAQPGKPEGVTLRYDVKTFKLSWAAVPASAGGGTVTYRVMEDADGPGAGAPVSIASGLTVTNYNREITGLLPSRLNATYSVEACDSTGCKAIAAPVAVDVAKAIGYFKGSDTESGAFFGSSVALAGDGNTLAVGALGKGPQFTGNSGRLFTGVVYVFARSGSGGAWSQQAYLTRPVGTYGDFGASLSISGDGNTLAVGARTEDGGATGVNGNPLDSSSPRSGAVYVFTRSSSTWNLQAYVKASNTGSQHHFGASVALSGDGNTLAVGAPLERGTATGVNGNQYPDPLLYIGETGAVYVFVRSDGTWSQQAYIKASNTEATEHFSDRFGSSVALSGDGNTLAAGAPIEASNATGVNGDQADNSAGASGAAYIFTRIGGVWSQQAYVKASNTGAGDYFGASLALSDDGNTLAVGAPGEDSSATGINGDQTNNDASGAGAVYVFARSGLNWSQQVYVKAGNARAGDGFGSVVALSGDGNVLAAGATSEDSAASGVNGDQFSSSGANSGAVYVFARSNGIWGQQSYLKAPNSEAGDSLGASMSLSNNGNMLAVGAILESSGATGISGDQANNGAPSAGAVYLY